MSLKDKVEAFWKAFHLDYPEWDLQQKPLDIDISKYPIDDDTLKEAMEIFHPDSLDVADHRNRSVPLPILMTHCIRKRFREKFFAEEKYGAVYFGLSVLVRYHPAFIDYRTAVTTLFF